MNTFRFKTYFKAIVIKAVEYYYKDRHKSIEQNTV